MENKMNRRKFLKASAAGGALMIAGDLLKGGSPVAYGEVTIARDDVFNAAKTPLVLLYAYSNTVAQELGRERAVGLMTKMFENIGAGQGKRMKEKAGSKEFDAKEAWPYFKTFPDTVGQTYQVVEESPQKVVARMRRCPLYEAARMLGMDSSTIEASCRAGILRSADAMVKQLNPNLNVRLEKFRSTPDDFCDHAIILG